MAFLWPTFNARNKAAQHIRETTTGMAACACGRPSPRSCPESNPAPYHQPRLASLFISWCTTPWTSPDGLACALMSHLVNKPPQPLRASWLHHLPLEVACVFCENFSKLEKCNFHAILKTGKQHCYKSFLKSKKVRERARERERQKLTNATKITKVKLAPAS